MSCIILLKIRQMWGHEHNQCVAAGVRHSRILKKGQLFLFFAFHSHYFILFSTRTLRNILANTYLLLA